MNQEIAEALARIELTKGEISVYLALLETGETTTGPLIKKSKITGSKVYEILNRLLEKGFAGFILRNNMKYFSPAEPELILKYIEKREEEIKEAKNKVEEILPSIKELLKQKEKTRSALIFEGWKGIATVFNMILEKLKAGEEYFAFSMGDDLQDKKVVGFLKNYHAKRAARKIKVRIIATSADRAVFEKSLAGLKLMKIRYYPNPLPLGVIIFRDFVATLSFREMPIAFLIKSERVADSYRRFSEKLWNVSEE